MNEVLGLPDADVARVGLAPILIFTLLFVIIPAYPILLDVRSYL
jgi:hypothetical protein